MALATHSVDQHVSPLFSLGVDVWYIVLDILREEPEPDEEEDDDEDPDSFWKPKRIARRLRHLPDLINMSSTCTWFRDLLAPTILGNLELYNTAKSAQSITAISRGKHAACVKTLRYIGICETDQQSSPLEKVYPPEVDRVLSNLRMFSNLDKLVIEFPFDYDDDLLIEYFQSDIFYPENAPSEESENAWRGLMAASLHAIVSNYTHSSSSGQPPLSIEFRDLNIFMVSIFTTDAFQSFLSQLTTFNLSIRRWDNGVGWTMMTQPIFSDFSHYLGPFFFNHLATVEEFSFDPRETASLGNGGQPYCEDIGLRNATMPRLRKVTLKNIILCSELRDFLVRHKTTLESIAFEDCFASGERPWQYGQPIDWRELFATLAQEPFSRLTNFQLTWKDSQLQMLDLDDTWGDPGLVQRVRQKLEREPDAKAFPYCEVDSKYGARYSAIEATHTAFLTGADYQSYVDLMSVLQRNGTHGGRVRNY
ncbi:hypothetical protein BDV37DRAFT_159673 [Aspergillus pseudonomiae]|uniref:F-box domain-containing protein n=1 Tax=Aspergillus pseudonomiae TaxID=1506151 RepID=A0A5N7D9Q7_9EURO|nr:uncharacterized protein BDV37DRAFT_159673 [Aspergillus pseudonomiae]KAE8402488.1 hypothetical protein BDV37DRAFT_159673 [Aspergillus pseudonomiae]